MISIHTFELRLDTNLKTFNYLLSHAYKQAKANKNRLGHSTKHTANDVRVDDALASDGITVEYPQRHIPENGETQDKPQ